MTTQHVINETDTANITNTEAITAVATDDVKPAPIVQTEMASATEVNGLKPADAAKNKSAPTTANAVVASDQQKGSITVMDKINQLNGLTEEQKAALKSENTQQALNDNIFKLEQLSKCNADTIIFLTDQDTLTAIRDLHYDVNELINFELAKIKALVSYSSIKAINNNIYTAKQLFNCDVKKLKLLTSEYVVNIITKKIYTAEQLLKYTVEEIQVLTSPPVLSSIENGYYTAKQLLEQLPNIKKIQALTDDQVTAVIKSKIFTAEKLLGCDPDKIEALTNEQAIKTIRPEKGSIAKLQDKAAEIAGKGLADKAGALVEKLSPWKKAAESKPDNEFKDVGLYTAKELLAFDTNKIIALTDDVSVALIINHIFSITQMLKFDVTTLEAFITKAQGYDDPGSAVKNLGKVYFYALNGEQLPLRDLLEKDNASANNNDDMESPLAVTVHAGFAPNAHLLVQHQGHFNHHDFVMDTNHVNELITYTGNILAKDELAMAFTGFKTLKEIDSCAKQFEDFCLVEGINAHDEL